MVCSNLSQAAFRRKLGGGMLVRTGSVLCWRLCGLTNSPDC